MNITLSPELQKRIAEKVERGGVETADALVEEALTFYLDYEEGETDEQEFRDTKAASSQTCGPSMAYRVEFRPGSQWVSGLEEAIYSLREMPDRRPIVQQFSVPAVAVRQLLYGRHPHVSRRNSSGKLKL